MNSKSIYLDLDRDYEDEGRIFRFKYLRGTNMYVGITKCTYLEGMDHHVSSILYEANIRFDENDIGNYLALYKLLKIFDISERSVEPVNAIQNLEKSVVDYIHSLGINQSEIIDEIIKICEEKISEIENEHQITLSIDTYDGGYISNIHIDQTKSFNIKRFDGSESKYYLSAESFNNMHGYGSSIKDSLSNLLITVKKYEGAIHEYVSELEEAINRRIDRIERDEREIADDWNRSE